MQPPLSLLSQLTRAALILFIAGASIAMAFCLASSSDLGNFVDTNVVSLTERRWSLNVAGASGALACILPGLYLLRNPNARGVAAIAFLADVVSPAMLAWAIPLFF